MFCPNCKTEYRAGFSRCSDCGAELVEQLDAPPVGSQNAAGPELLWTGTDPAIRGVIINALDDAEIPHHESMRDVGPLPGLAPPIYAVFIPSRHHNAARTAMEKAVRELENGAQQPDDTLAGSELLSSDLEPDEKDEATSVPDDIPKNYRPDEATAKVWSGTDVETKDMLVASLRENGIGCELDANGNFQIRVMPSDESIAREIIREVTDASPPE